MKIPIDYRFLTIPDGVTKLFFKGFGDHREILDVENMTAVQVLTAQGRWNRRSGLFIGTSGKWHEWYHLGSVCPATPDDISRHPGRHGCPSLVVLSQRMQRPGVVRTSLSHFILWEIFALWVNKPSSRVSGRAMDEQLIHRARTALCYLTETEVIEHLMISSEITAPEAFLAVTAAQLLLKHAHD